MDQSSGSPKPGPDDTAVLCTPPPANKRPTSHVATPDLDHQAKKFKMEDKTQESATTVPHDDGALTQHSLLDNVTFGNRLDSQSPEDFLMGTPQDLVTLITKYGEEQAHLRDDLKAKKEEIRELEIRVSIKDKQLQQLKDYIAVQHLQPNTVTVQGPDDSAVTSKFTALLYAITNLTLNELNGHPFSKPNKIDHKNLFARLTNTEEDYKDYLGNSGFKGFFFEGVIWTKLIDRLLCSPISAFLDIQEGVIRDHVYNRGGASPQKFHAWRAYTADFLEDALGARIPWRPGGKLRSQFVEELVELLSRYSTSGTGNVGALTQQLHDIIDKAVNLAWLMAKSRAYWVCALPTCPETKLPHGFIYNNAPVKVHQTLEGGRRNIVDLIGRPALTKYGDSNGDQYDTWVVVHMADALVYGGKKKKTADENYVNC